MPPSALVSPLTPPARAGFALLVALLALVGAGKAVLYDTLDPDVFFHLLAADQMAREGVGPIVDGQSFMSVREPWTPYSWLAEFGMKFVWDLAGYRAAVATHAVLSAALIALIALACAERAGGTLVRATVATAAAAFMSLPYLSFRPVTAALVVMAACAWLLTRDRAGGERSRAVWLVVPLTALLVNLHLYALVLPAWPAALCAGALWEQWRAAHFTARAEAGRRAIRYALLTAGCAAACLATPMLPGVVRSALAYQTGDPWSKPGPSRSSSRSTPGRRARCRPGSCW
jgi:hypothetical protein